jgi:hypothetical protein
MGAGRKRFYHTPEWEWISRYVRSARAGGVCEHCGVLHGAISGDGRKIIRLACAHLNGDLHDLRPENLRALCPQCHYFYDQLRRLRTFFERHPELLGRRARRRTPQRFLVSGAGRR